LGKIGKIILIAIPVTILIFILLVLIAVMQSLLRKPEFKVTQTAITDNNGFPSIKLVFETEKYPLTFKLFTREGELVDQTIASQGETVEYLSFTGSGYKKNLIGPKSFVIKTYYGGEEIYNRSIEVKGVIPKLTWDNIPLETQTSILGISLKTIRFKVKNEGDIPLYIYVLSEDFKCYLDEDRLSVSVEDTVVMPGEETLVKASPVFTSISYDKLGSKHSVEVNVAGSKLTYEIQPLSPRIEIINLGCKPLFGETMSLENLTVKIENTWSLPINAKWAEIVLNTEKTSYYLDKDVEVKPGETVEATYKLVLMTANKGSVVTVKVRISKTEAVKTITIP